MSELTDKRWEKGEGKPSSHKLREALEVALHRLDVGEIEADHVIVCFGHTDDGGGDSCSFFQAGNYSHYGQLGILEAVKFLMSEAAEP